MTLLELVIRGFATFYLVVAFLDFQGSFVRHFKAREAYLTTYARHGFSDRQVAKRTRWLVRLQKWLDRKPFNCYFCLSFWLAIPMNYPTVNPRNILAVAGVAVLLFVVKDRLETFL